MRAYVWLWCALTFACPSVLAAEPTFGDLLAKAQAQYEAGHRWSPPGDNMVETVARMMDMISTATPEQLTELSALLAKGAAPPAQTGKPATGAPPPPTATTLQPAPAPSPEPAPAPQPAPVPQAAPAPQPASVPQAAPAPQPAPVVQAAPASPKPSPEVVVRAAELLARARQAETFGDISGARRLYASAATLGNAEAALGAGRLYDPAFLGQSALGGVEADPALARHWYQRAQALGDPEAGRLLQALSGR